MVALGFLRAYARPIDIVKSGNIIVAPLNQYGKIDYDKVPVGKAIWVTIDHPDSPLHGRDVLVTRTARGYILGERDTFREAKGDPAKNREAVRLAEEKLAQAEDEHGIWGGYAGKQSERHGVLTPWYDEDEAEAEEDLTKSAGGSHWMEQPRDDIGRWEEEGTHNARTGKDSPGQRNVSSQVSAHPTTTPEQNQPDEWGDAPEDLGREDEPEDDDPWRGKDDEQRDLLSSIQRAAEKGSHDELAALRQLADSYDLTPDDVQQAIEMGGGTDDEAHEMRHQQILERISEIENSPHGEVFKHINDKGQFKRRNAYTGKQLNERDRSGKLRQSYGEAWNHPMSGYDEVMDVALSNHYGKNRNVAADPTLDEFYDHALKLWKERRRLKRLAGEYKQGLHKSESEESSPAPQNPSMEGKGHHDGTDVWLHHHDLEDDRSFWRGLEALTKAAGDDHWRNEPRAAGRWTTGGATAGENSAPSDEEDPEEREHRIVKAVLPQAHPGHLRSAYRGSFEVNTPNGPAEFNTSPHKIDQFSDAKGAPPGVKVSGDIVHKGRKIGTFERGIMKMPNGDLVAKHNLLAVNHKDLQGHGFGHAFNKQSEEFYKKHGVKKILLQANITVGAYAWAKQGYDFADAATRAHAVEQFVLWAKTKQKVDVPTKVIQKLNDGHSWDLAGYDDGKLYHVEAWDDNGRKSVDGSYPLGKAFLLSGAMKNGWHGVKSLEEGSPSQKISKRYDREHRRRLAKSMLVLL